jgi:nitroreductase
VPLEPLPAPRFGDVLPVEPSPDTIKFLARRRSASAVGLTAPGPSGDELRTILTLAARAPDHGKLAPWRFIVLRDAAKTAFVERLEGIAAKRADSAKALAKLVKVRTPPVSVVVVSRAVVGGDIPIWEQQMSAGAVCVLLLIAAQAMGFGANWITDWYAYDTEATRLLGLSPGELVAGYLHLGHCADAPHERVRPDMSALVQDWAP